MSIADKISAYTNIPKYYWQIIEQFKGWERDEAKKVIGEMVEAGDLFCIKGDTPATEESWSYFSRQAIDDEILEAIANGLTVEAAIERVKEGCRFTITEEAQELQKRVRMLIDAGAIKEKTPPETRLTPPGNQKHKTDEGKPLAGCLLEFGQALEALASVATHGATRYGRGTWKRVERQRYIDALMRHVLAMGPECSEFDTDSGLPHIVHVLWNAAAIIELKGNPNVEV